MVGNVAQLPTLWSNTLAGWLLCGGGNTASFCALLLGLSSLYLGGMFLRFAWDPPHAGLARLVPGFSLSVINRQTLALSCLGWFFLGSLLLVLLGRTTAVLAIVLLALTLLNVLLPGQFTLARISARLWRFLIYLTAGAATDYGINGTTVWSSLAMTLYVQGIQLYEQQSPTVSGLKRFAPTSWLVMPLLFACLINGNGYHLAAVSYALLLGLWIYWCIHDAFGKPHAEVQLAWAHLTTGIVLVDLLAVAASIDQAWVFFLCFFGALVLQRTAPVLFRI